MKELVDKIINIGNCSSCGGEYSIHGICAYCNKKNNELEELFNKIIEIIKNNNAKEINEVDNQLFRLKYYKEINEYLLSKNYYKLLKVKEDELINKIYNDKNYNLSDEESKLVQFFSVNSLNREYRKSFGLYVILSNFVKKSKYSKEEFLESLNSYVLSIMSEHTYIPKFIVENFSNTQSNKELLGSQSFVKHDNINESVIKVSDTEIDKLYNGESILPLQTIYHEYIHLMQAANLKEAQVFNKEALYQIEDFLLTKMIGKKDYYDVNYAHITFESEAEISSISMIKTLIDSFNIKLNDLDNKELETNLFYAMMSQNDKDKIREYDGKRYNLDILFDMFMLGTNKYKEAFEMYLQLLYIYEFKDGRYYRKPKETIDKIVEVFSVTGADLNNFQINMYKNNVEKHSKLI